MTAPEHQPSPGLDLRLIKALAHPLRYRILVRLNLGEASPVEMARELGEPVGRVSHHVRTLRRLGAIELVREVPRRGAVQHYYRAVTPAWFTDEDWADVPASARTVIVGQNIRDVVHDLTAAGQRGFELPRMHLSRMPLTLDEQALDEVVELLNATLARLQEIQAASFRRSAEATVATEAVILHFQRPDD